MNPVVDKWIDEHTDELVARVRRCIAFPTVLDESTAGPGAPFGRVTAECLEDTLAQGREMGFEAKNLDGYCGYIDFGAGEEQLALICHLDVVPEGTGWLYPPYAGEVHDGRFYGRGTMDDKGPAFAALFGMAAIKASGLEMKRRVRLILGCNEESGMECMKHYKKVEKDPDIAFSPDAEYPVVNSEKSGYHGAYHKLYASKVRMHGGTVSNAVPGEMVIEVPFTLNRILPIMEAFMEKSDPQRRRGGGLADPATAGADDDAVVLDQGLHAPAPSPACSTSASRSSRPCAATLGISGKCCTGPWR